jgi:hypothetical protein
MDKQDYSNMSEIFKHACIEELALYNTNWYTVKSDIYL